MMKRIRPVLIAFASVVALEGAGAVSAQGQTPIAPAPLTPSQKPVTSPYLNLATGNNFGGTAFQYFRLVRPEQEFRRANAMQGSEIRSLQQQFADQRQMLQSPESALGPTGHRTVFLNTGSYFPGSGRQPRR